MRVICDRDLRRFTSLNLVVKVQAERAGPMGLRREDGSPLGPTPGYARGRFTTAFLRPILPSEPLETSHLLIPRQAVRPVAMPNLLRLALRRIQEG